MHSAGDRILHLLKSRGPASAAMVTRHLGITAVGARQHLAGLAEQGLVRFDDLKGHVGRPRRIWSLTEKAEGRFPDNHAFLTLELIAAARAAFGEAGLERLVADRERTTLRRYEDRLRGKADLRDRVAALSRLRSEEGYMAEWQRLPDGALLLVENHCPICAAARQCQGFCRSELDLFRRVLGDGASIERIDHILAGARRCAYRISPA